MILIDQRFLSADHIQYIYVTQFSDGKCAVIVKMIDTQVVFSKPPMDQEMAFELRRRIVKAIVNYKSSEKPEIQQVKIPTYEEVHPQEISETE